MLILSAGSRHSFLSNYLKRNTIMRRRSPPTSLRLVQGPVPPRSYDVLCMLFLTFGAYVLLLLQSAKAHAPVSAPPDLFAASRGCAWPHAAPADAAKQRRPRSCGQVYGDPSDPHPSHAVEPRKHAGALGPLGVDHDAHRHGESVDAVEASCVGVVGMLVGLCQCSTTTVTRVMYLPLSSRSKVRNKANLSLISLFLNPLFSFCP